MNGSTDLASDTPESPRGLSARLSAPHLRWGLFLATIAAAVYFSIWVADLLFWRSETTKLNAMTDDEISATLARDWSPNASTDYLDALSDRAMRLSPPDIHSATRAVKAALDKDPRRPFALARLAYLETVAAGKPTADAIAAMEASFRTCPACDVDLMKWRLDYIYGQWDDVSPHLQQLAVEHVQILGDTYREHDYIAELRFKAENADIPFEYNSIDKYLEPVD